MLRPAIAIPWMLVGLLLAGGALAAIDAPRDGVISKGDHIDYHITAYNAANEVVFTSDATKGATGATALAQNESLYGLRGGPFEMTKLNDTDPHRFLPSMYLAGHRQGDIIRTPLIVEPFGARPVYFLPRTIGPVALEFDVNFTNARGEPTVGIDAAKMIAGNVVPYAQVLEALVTEANETRAHLVVQGDVGTTFDSIVLGLPLKISKVEDGQATLEPQASVGQQFNTQGCSLPGNVIFPGNYTVTSEVPEGYYLDMDMGQYEVLYGQPLRFELEIVKVRDHNPWTFIPKI